MPAPLRDFYIAFYTAQYRRRPSILPITGPNQVLIHQPLGKRAPRAISPMHKAWSVATLLLILLLSAGCRPSPVSPIAPTDPETRAPSAVTPQETGESAVEQAAPGLASEVNAALDIAAPWLIFAERQAANAGDIAMLAQLWAPESRVIDRRGAPSPARYYRWEGKAAVLNRYVVAVFPHRPPPLADNALDTLQLTVDNSTSSHTTSSHTAASRNEDSIKEESMAEENLSEGSIRRAVNGKDHWQFIWRANRWWLLELSYSSY